ncbi:hypothetical protein CkaCkLH20_13217 [Colletotrichum karsti]|uniref:Uncharacterized protein n=1 Tax=Colletotrichum karsti TaxID=1095194 RepID=A0A9P6HSZ7_9PEZI|nr:uncharacterized protein CkaCkLH20_13217 [Colletotrichum karsti]KAF9869300.1 hypothetical protein CkaCkLH20_13217 [Colletotrichum karsti]
MSELPLQKPLNCTYQIGDVVLGLTQYYLTLTRAAYIPATYVDFPPAEGWTDAELDVGALRALRRSETVINLLRHLPYPRPMHDGPRPGPWNVAPKTKAVRYLRHLGDFSKWSDRGDAGLLELAALPFSQTPAGPMDLPPDVINLTYGERVGAVTPWSGPYWWIVDCSRGILSPFQENSYGVAKVPRNKPWRTAQSYAVADFFAQLIPEIGVNWLPLPPTEELDAEVLEPFSEPTNLPHPSEIYSQHGWPGEGFRHEECIVALQNYRRQLLEQQRKEEDDDADDEDFEMEDSDNEMEEGASGLEDAMADVNVEVEDLAAEAAALHADIHSDEWKKFKQQHDQWQVPFEWVDSE